jgi:AcrR family transcriptional regulator
MPRAVKRRRYESPVRREQAERTRARILEAAAHSFEAQGYARTTISAIADEADVAVDTVYAIFGNKARVLTALMDRRLTAGSGHASIVDRPEWLSIRNETNQRKQIALFARDYSQMAQRVRPVNRVLRSAAAVDPELARVHKEMMGYRRKNWRRVIDWIASNGPLRVPVARAADIAYALASPEVSELLCDTLGWSTEEYGEWLDQTLTESLIGRAGRPLSTKTAQPPSKDT